MTIKKVQLPARAAAELGVQRAVVATLVGDAILVVFVRRGRRVGENAAFTIPSGLALIEHAFADYADAMALHVVARHISDVARAA